MIKVNGKSNEEAKGRILTDFLESEGYSMARIAVECNGEIIPKAAYGQKVLKEGDCLEIVNFVGGG